MYSMHRCSKAKIMIDMESAVCRTHISDFREGHLYTPQLTLIPETVLADQLQLSIQTFLLKRTPGLLECFSICTR